MKIIKKIKLTTAAYFVSLLVLVICIASFLPAIVNYDSNSKQINTQAIEDTVRDYVVQCYATEGSYPADLYYLQENYGLILQEDLYFYSYEVFASNIMPNIQVFAKNGE